MNRSVAVLALFLLLTAPLAVKGATVPPEVENFLRSRKVLGTVVFAEGSSALDSVAKQVIDRVVPRLESLDASLNLVRIEGFASATGNRDVNVPISMVRAQVVIDYIRSHHPLALDLFLTGFGGSDTGGVSESPGCRAEIAIYDNIWQMEDAGIEKLVQR